MKAFCRIVEQIINNDKNVSYSKMEHFLLTLLISKKYSLQNKFLFYKETNNNMFLNAEIKEKFNYLFCLIQMVYSSFQKLAYIYKYNKTKIMVETDMGLNKIVINSKNTICIFQNNGKYLFNIFDLIKISDVSLTNSYMFFSEPLPIKNPYNNIPFSKSNLYNIYFFIKYNTNIYSELFFKYFNTNFNLVLFNKKYEYVLREHSINNYIIRSSDFVLYRDILQMINSYNFSKKQKIKIDCDFPKKTLIKIMKPYLLLYLRSLYSLININKGYSYLQLNNKLQQFCKFNSKFGRKIIHIEPTISLNINSKINSKIKYSFNEHHIKFNKSDTTFFLSSHSKISSLYDNESIQLINNEIISNIYVNNYDDDDDDDDDDDYDDENGGDGSIN